MKRAFARAIEKALYMSSALLSGICTLLFMHYQGITLNTSLIFSILEMMILLKTQILNLSLGFGMVFEFNVILERFAQVYNIKKTKMIKINERSQKENVPLNESKE